MGRDRLRLLMHGRATEEPARKVVVEDLQAAKEVSASTQSKQRREIANMNAKATLLEAKIMALNKENLELSERHKAERTKLQEQQNRLRTFAKRERELVKQLDVMASRLNEAVRLRLQVNDPAAVSVDYRNLPGVRVNKLTNWRQEKDPPPAPQLQLTKSPKADADKEDREPDAVQH